MGVSPSSPVVAQTPLRIRFDRFEIDEGEARLTCDGKPLHLAPKPLALLCALARAPRTLVTKSALLDDVWGHQFVSDSVLKTTISDLRAALQDDPKQPRYIETVSRRGYRFISTIDQVGEVAIPGTVRAEAESGAPQPAAVAPSIGRADVMARLHQAWRAAGTGRRQIVWVSGEAGVGKTTVIERFMREVGEGRTAHGHCVEQFGAGEPHLAILEALTGLCRSDPSIVEMMRAVAPTWLFQLPWLSSADERESLRRELSGASPGRMLREMGELLDRYTEERPLLLVTEDMHWSDHATVQLMDYLARRRSGARMMWLASFRLTELIAAEHPLATVRQELRLHGLGTEIVLDGFSEAEVGEYLRVRAPSIAAEPPLVRALHDRTDGLPLFVAGVVDDIVSHPDADADPHERFAAMAIPETLSGVIERYIDELAPGHRALLEAASVCGVQFRVSTLARVLEMDAAAVADSCAELARQQRWLRDVPATPQKPTAETGYIFRHALYREVLYKRLARAELHRKVATALERMRAEGNVVSPAELASHFDLAGEPASAVRFYAEAAESALLRFSPAQTLSLTERAMVLLPRLEPGEARTALEVALAALQGTASMQVMGICSTETRKAFERALPLLDEVPQHPLRGLVLSVLGFAYHMRGQHDDAARIVGKSEALWNASGDRMALVCACVVQGLLDHDRGRPASARDWLEKGVAAVAELDASASRAVFVADPGVIMFAILAIELQQLGLVDQARERMLAARARAEALREPGPRQAAYWLEALYQVGTGDASGVADAAERLARLQAEYDAPEGKAAALWFRGWAEAHLGDPKAGHRLVREGCEEASRIGMRAFAGETLGYAAEALVLAGDATAARQAIAEAVACAQAAGDVHCLPRLRLLEARIADALGDARRARESLQEAIAEARSQEALWPELLASTALCERGDATGVERKALRRVVDRLTEGLDAPPVARARALLARPVRALA